MCGKQKALSSMILEVWQGKELGVDFLDVWQMQGLAD
jgi:hypothetical protein